MCTLSMVYDHYQYKFPNPPVYPYVEPSPAPYQLFHLPRMQRMVELYQKEKGNAIAELRQLVAEFREAVAAAKTLDRLLKQPDCEDLEKKRLEELVAELERRLDVETK